MVRLKKRYVLCEIVTRTDQRVKREMSEGDVYRAVREALRSMHGDFGVGSIGISLRVKYVNQLTGTVFIQCRREGHKMLLTSLPFVKQIGGSEAFLKTLHLSGTLRSSQKFLVKYQRRRLVALLGETTNLDERREIQKAIINCGVSDSAGTELEWPSGSKDAADNRDEDSL